MLQDVSLRSGQQETKLLHSAVSAHGKAKKELYEAELARVNLHSSWRRFLADSAVQWQKYSDMFLQQETELLNRVQAAKDALTAAKETLSTSKVAAGVDSREEAAAMSEEEGEKDLSAATAAKISGGFTQLSTGLQTLQQQAEQAEKEEQQAMKRPRVDPPGAEHSTPAPFGGLA